MFEFTYDSITAEQAQAYLDRIGFKGEHVCSKEALDELVLCHQCSVPFENLDIIWDLAPIKLDTPSLYDKVVTRRRGGFCFELNGAFVLLLRALGYDAYSCYCRTANGRTEFGNLAHRGVVVRLDGKVYICDVGLGGPMASFAVEVSPERQTKNGETYWVEELAENWLLQMRLDSSGNPSTVIVFALQPFLQKDFEPLCNHMLSSPGTSFKKNTIVNLRTRDGHRHVRDNKLSVAGKDGSYEQEITLEELKANLQDWFGLNI